MQSHPSIRGRAERVIGAKGCSRGDGPQDEGRRLAIPAGDVGVRSGEVGASDEHRDHRKGRRRGEGKRLSFQPYLEAFAHCSKCTCSRWTRWTRWARLYWLTGSNTQIHEKSGTVLLILFITVIIIIIINNLIILIIVVISTRPQEYIRTAPIQSETVDWLPLPRESGSGENRKRTRESQI